MKRRSKAGGKPVKTRRRKAVAPKRGTAPKAAPPSRAAGLSKKVAQFKRERDEALARQAATAGILRIISQSPGDVQPIFDNIVFTAVRLLGCDLVFVMLCEGAVCTPTAVASPEGPLAYAGPRNFPIDPSANFPSRAIVAKKMLYLPDWSRIDLPEHERNIHTTFGVNSALYLPLLREGECIGLLTLVGRRPNMFGAAEIAQAEAFRDQALIAIENARLFNETQEALEQQTATSEVLRVISASTGELGPVFDVILRKAHSLCDAPFGGLMTYDGEFFRLAAQRNVPPAWAEWVRGPLRPGPKHPLSRFVKGEPVLQIPDMRELADREPDEPMPRAGVDLGGIRTILYVPLRKDGVLFGVITLSPGGAPFYRQTDRAVADIRRPGRHRHRKRAAADRTARVAAAADRHRRRAQGHQPLDLRPASGARHLDRVCGPALRGRRRFVSAS